MKVLLAAAALVAGAGCGAGRAIYVIDQIEGSRAVLVGEHGEVVGAAIEDLPEGAREGDVLVDGRPDPTERARLEAEAEALRRQLARGDVGADLSLESP
jgi:hypothetical protein